MLEKHIDQLRRFAEKKDFGVLDRQASIEYVIEFMKEVFQKEFEKRKARTLEHYKVHFEYHKERKEEGLYYDEKALKPRTAKQISKDETTDFKLASERTYKFGKERVDWLIRRQFEPMHYGIRQDPPNAKCLILQASEKLAKELEEKEKNRLLHLGSEYVRFLNLYRIKNLPDVKSVQSYADLAAQLPERETKNFRPNRFSDRILQERWVIWMATHHYTEESVGDSISQEKYDLIQEAIWGVGESGYSYNRKFNDLFLDSDGMELTHELAIALNEEKLEKYLDSFTAHNLYKLGSAITKHITSEMEPLGEVSVDEGMKGIEIWTPISTPEGRRFFKARCILAGGPMVRYHYRYIAHLVKEDR